jgi:hypothetical protein
LTQALLNKGADARDRFGKASSIVGNAIIGGNPEVLSLILGKTAEIPATVDIEGRSPLQAAALRGHEEIVDMLLARRVDPNTPDPRGYTPLLAAAEGRHWKIAQKLIKAGANVNGFGFCKPDCRFGHTALSLAAEHNDVVLAKLLLVAGADFNAHDKLAVREAELNGNVEVYQLLKQAGATYPVPKDAHPVLDLIRKGKLQPPPAAPAPGLPIASNTANGPSLSSAHSGSSGEVRLAIIADDPVASDALTAALSHQPGFALLERSEIERILTEHHLTESGLMQAASGACLGLLGADAVVSISRGSADRSQLYEMRIISVGSGLVLDSLFYPAPLKDAPSWTGDVAKRISTLKEKLARKPNSAIALAFLNLNATVGTASGLEVEDELKLLLTHRLVQEPRLFVLERTKMNQLVQEKNFSSGSSNQFWSGAFLVEGKIDLPLAQSSIFSVHLRLQPALDSKNAPLEFSVEGDRNHLAECVEKTVSKIREALIHQQDNTTTVWNPQDEANRFFQEARWAEACNSHEVAAAAADSSWALGLRTPEVAQLRVSGRAGSILERADRLRENIRRSVPDEIAIYYMDPLNHPFRGTDCPTPAEFLNAGIRLLEASDEGIHTDSGADAKGIGKALSAAAQAIQLVATASDQVENAESLILLRQLLRQVANESLTKWPDDAEFFGSYVRVAHCFSETDAELVECLNKAVQHHFPKDDVLNRAILRETIVNILRSVSHENDPFRVQRRWRAAWRSEYTDLCKSTLPEDQVIGSYAQEVLETSARERRAAANRFVEQFAKLRPEIATDTRALTPYLRLFYDFDKSWELCPFFSQREAVERGKTILKRTEPWYELLRDFFVYLCENSRDIDTSVLSLGQMAGFAPADLVTMNDALSAQIGRQASLPGADPHYLAMLNRHKFDVPSDSPAEPAPVHPPSSAVPSNPPSSNPLPSEPGSLLVTQHWNPAKSAGVQSGVDGRNFLVLPGLSLTWAEDRVWCYGEFGNFDVGPEKGYVFCTDLKTLKTEAIPLPAFTSRLDYGSTLGITPSRIFVCRPGEFLAVYRRDSKQWDVYQDIKPLPRSMPVALGDRLYLLFETPDQNTGLLEFSDDKAKVLASTRRNPPESPADIPGGHIQGLDTNERGEVKIIAYGKPGGPPSALNTIYSPDTKTWREMQPGEHSDFWPANRTSCFRSPHETFVVHPTGVKAVNGKESAALTYTTKSDSVTVPIDFKAEELVKKPWACNHVMATPYGLVFAPDAGGKASGGTQLWFASQRELSGAIGRR